MMSIGVFGGFSAGEGEQYRTAARELGTLIGQGGHRLVYGGGRGGLMGEVAAATLAAGGTALGVIPEFLVARDRIAHTPIHPVVHTPDLFERKRIMIAESDCFVALPGGYGTLDEVLDVVAMRALGVLSAPLVLLDIDGAWQGFLTVTGDLRSRGFIRRDPGFQLADTAAAAFTHLASLHPVS
ncbi:MAG: amidase [Nocardia sp.]|uniref:LOG family protein n=1 Tax=Nocardia sp. TaxID=1821 RepID=UPI00261C77A7|nr:TIGR00730 family Rossman fold protein [Nocardia sp.]MCU1640724.1 amidase [Nocardia sp.]